jgi:NADPH:quinone reductase-like Zn-dependent oxidoreductase
MLFDRLRMNQPAEGSLLILGGAGGVGSIATQLARQLTRLTVIATASRPETVQWCLRMGANPLLPAFRANHSCFLAALDSLFSLNSRFQYHRQKSGQ